MEYEPKIIIKNINQFTRYQWTWCYYSGEAHWCDKSTTNA